MSITTTIEDGKVVLPEGVNLPNGTVVRLETVEEDVPALYEMMKDFEGKGPAGITDMAKNHNHYLHGHAKQ